MEDTPMDITALLYSGSRKKDKKTTFVLSTND
jgi:hypothetical protein